MNTIALQSLLMDWSLESFLGNANNAVVTIGGAFIILLGTIMIVVAGWQIAKGLISRNSQTNWFIVIALLIVGGIFAAGGIVLLQNLAAGLGEEAEKWGSGQNMIVPYLSMLFRH